MTATAVVAVASIGLSAAGCGGDDESSAGSRAATVPLVPATSTATVPPQRTTSTTSTTAAGRPAPRPRAQARPRRTLRARLAAALKPFNARVMEDGSSPAELLVTARTPVVDQITTDQLDRRAGEILQAVYGRAGHKTAAVVVFRGGLKDPSTGRRMANTVAAIYTLRGRDAAEIEWSDPATPDIVDWAPYRLTLHPALR